MKLKDFIQLLETLAPPELAEEWDNAGLLIEPLNARDIKTVLLTIDLTEDVAHEAVRLHADFIVAYHPIFFGGFQTLEKSNPQARTAMMLIEKGIGVYSPHTALDAAPGGVNDWLAGLFDGEVSAAGTARLIALQRPILLPALGKQVKEKLKLKTVQIAPAGKTIKTIALCAGSGIEALRDIQADCYLTGEMKHHDVLAAVQNGTSVILCGHTETERGYLPILGKNLRRACEPEMQIMLSKTDRAPLRII
ncbi:MAG: Nif3-like dinuclear metal center hexameric protein [Pontiellaceae bacterium]|jgi:dinuclear metal center YbgI/SA1388 family protein|nr:Nif3-like dinuclear metal center hexameric protein [Pontiellaceae bacterium]